MSGEWSDLGATSEFAVDLEGTLEVREVRLATGAEEAAEFTEGAVQEAVERALARELSRGKVSLEVEVVRVEEDPERRDPFGGDS